MSLLCLQLSSTKLSLTFESTAELNYLGRSKLVLGSAHVKYSLFDRFEISNTCGKIKETEIMFKTAKAFLALSLILYFLEISK